MKYSKLLLVFSFLFVFGIDEALAKGLSIVEKKKKADELYQFKEYDQSLSIYYDLANNEDNSKPIRSDCFKKAGMIRYTRGEYLAAKDHLIKAQDLGMTNDKRIQEILKTIAKIGEINDSDGINQYIIQVGFFKSSINANNTIKRIIPIDGEFSIIKKKIGDFYVVYFDSFKSREEADKAAIQLNSLNGNLDLLVKRKGF